MGLSDIHGDIFGGTLGKSAINFMEVVQRQRRLSCFFLMFVGGGVHCKIPH